jgi:hypothetical protein
MMGPVNFPVMAAARAICCEKVNNATLQVNLGDSQRNAALVEETASASQSMGEQARELQELMSFFKLGEQQTQADFLMDQQKKSMRGVR